jgi:RNA polymerase sigma factor (sigma-70 family)
VPQDREAQVKPAQLNNIAAHIIALNNHASTSGKSNDDLWRDFFEEHRGVVYGICLKYVRNRDDALDLTQQTFIKFFENYDSIRTSSEGYLRTIARNLSLNFLSQERRIDRNEDIETLAERDKAESGFPFHVGGMIRSAFRKLDDYSRMVLFYLSEGFKIHEIARLLKADEGKVRSDSARCRRKAIYALYLSLDSKDLFSADERFFIECTFGHAHWSREKIRSATGLSEHQFTTMHEGVLRKLEAHID